jgi:hypothetical protein
MRNTRFLIPSATFLLGAVVALGAAWLFGLLGSTTVHKSDEPAELVELTLQATIDGSDRFVFSRDKIKHEHGTLGSPRNVYLNSEPWENLNQSPEHWRELARDLDLEKAVLTWRNGRDVAALETEVQGFSLYFADTPLGAGHYAVTVMIPRRR